MPKVHKKGQSEPDVDIDVIDSSVGCLIFLRSIDESKAAHVKIHARSSGDIVTLFPLSFGFTGQTKLTLTADAGRLKSCSYLYCSKTKNDCRPSFLQVQVAFPRSFCGQLIISHSRSTVHLSPALKRNSTVSAKFFQRVFHIEPLIDSTSTLARQADSVCVLSAPHKTIHLAYWGEDEHLPRSYDLDHSLAIRSALDLLE